MSCEVEDLGTKDFAVLVERSDSAEQLPAGRVSSSRSEKPVLGESGKQGSSRAGG